MVKFSMEKLMKNIKSKGSLGRWQWGFYERRVGFAEPYSTFYWLYITFLFKLSNVFNGSNSTWLGMVQTGLTLASKWKQQALSEDSSISYLEAALESSSFDKFCFISQSLCLGFMVPTGILFFFNLFATLFNYSRFGWQFP